MQNNHSGYRGQVIKVKTAKRRNASSNRWLRRQLNDSYVAKSKLEGYRSRAAYKLIEINDKFRIFKPGQRAIDLGAAPGGWSQVAAKLICSSQYKNHITAIDLLEIKPIENVLIVQGDFLEARAGLCDCLVDVVMSDMAANTIGHAATDHLRTMFLCEQAFEFACQVLKPGGHFISKIFRGGAENELLKKIKSQFEVVKHFKPAASRKESSELYLVALGRRG